MGGVLLGSGKLKDFLNEDVMLYCPIDSLDECFLNCRIDQVIVNHIYVTVLFAITW